MLATFAGRLAALVALAIVVGLAMYTWRRFSRNPFFLPQSRRGKPIGWFHIGCGILGVLILVAICLATWQDVRWQYTAALTRVNPTIKVPTLPPPVVAAGNGLARDTPEKTRLLVTVSALDVNSPEIGVVAVAQKEIDWPRQKEVSFRLEFLGIRCDYKLSLLDVQLLNADASSAGALALQKLTKFEPLLHGDQIVRWDGPNGMSGSNGAGGTIWERKMTLIPGPGMIGFRFTGSAPLSLAINERLGYAIASVVTCVQPDDPLRSVPLAEFHPVLSEVSEASKVWLRPPLTEWDLAGFHSGSREGIRRPVSVMLAARLEMSALLLIASAVLLAQVFARRDLAMAGLLLGMVLFVAGWERGMLAYDMAWMKDSTAPIAARYLAGRRVGDTFFFGETAKRAFEEVKIEHNITRPFVLEGETRS